MVFNQDNKIVQLCIKGMELEGIGKTAEASGLFNKAWNSATNDFEKFVAGHYVARHQISVSDKLKWDEAALKYALKVDDETVKGALPSLYLNIGKCHEDLSDFKSAKSSYQQAVTFLNYLPNNGYGTMIKRGINDGLDRLK